MGLGQACILLRDWERLPACKAKTSDKGYILGLTPTIMYYLIRQFDGMGRWGKVRLNYHAGSGAGANLMKEEEAFLSPSVIYRSPALPTPIRLQNPLGLFFLLKRGSISGCREPSQNGRKRARRLVRR